MSSALSLPLRPSAVKRSWSLSDRLSNTLSPLRLRAVAHPRGHAYPPRLPSRGREQRLDERFRVELRQVVHRLAGPDEQDRHFQLLHDGEHHPTARGAVQLGYDHTVDP